MKIKWGKLKRSKKKINVVFILWIIGFLIIGLYNMPEKGKEIKQDFYSISLDKKARREIILKGGNGNVNVNFNFEGKPLKLNHKCIQCDNRYYLDMEDVCSVTGDELKIEDDYATINDVKIDLKSGRYQKGKKWKDLRGEAVMVEDKLYMTMIDITELLNLKTSWDSTSSTISIFKNRQVLDKEKAPKSLTKRAYMRLEDVTAGDVYSKDENLEKFRIEGDYLEQKGAKFHVAWVPRYVNPEKNIDNDLLKNLNFSNAHFLYTLDYLIDRGAVVGLHGYTHQFGDAESIIGSEFQDSFNQTYEEKKTKVETALNTANRLNIPHVFFETPHYRSSEEFQTMLEEYFNYVYEPCIGVWNYNVYKSVRNNRTKFIPAPLGYVKDKNVDEMIDKIKAKDENLKSFYYHPSKEFEYIKIEKDENGYPYYKYDENSMLHKLINEIYKEGYSLKSIEDFK